MAEHELAGGCACGRHTSPHAHDLDRLVTEAALRALLPGRTRRAFLQAVGTGTAMAAIASVLPLGALQSMAQEKPRSLEKTELTIGFVPITCSTPLIAADPHGFYSREGLKVTLQKAAGWALVRDRLLNRELDASHMLSPMPLAISMGLGAEPRATRVACIQNVNGQAIVLALKHKDNRDPKNWKGLKFAIPFDYSMHNFLLRYYLAEYGIDPDQDVQLRVTPPPEMIANLRAGNIDGFLGPDPFVQRAVYDEVGFIHVLSREIWDGHPCCAFGATEAFIRENPNSFAALFRAVLAASDFAHDPANRPAIAKTLATPNYLNQPETVVTQALTGKFADGLGQVRDVPDRADFLPVPWYSMATWMLTQMKRWGYVKGDVDYRSLAEQVFLLTDARRLMAELNLPVPEAARQSGYRSFTVMGRAFDPARPDDYVAGFAIKRG